jgi:hypothetical protein
MRRNVLRFLVLGVTAVSLMLLPSLGLAQGSAKKAKQADSAAKPAAKATAKKEAAKAEKAGGRLPNYYADVVTPEQREKILAVQAEYADKIDALKAELQSVQDKRDAAIDKLLSSEQLRKIAAAKAAAKAKSAKAQPAKSDVSKADSAKK